MTSDSISNSGSSVSRVSAIALTGLEGSVIAVEAAVTQQLPGMAIIGLPDAALAEAKQRVRTAAAQAGLPLAERFVVVNLAPAALPKQGSGFDLAIALAAIAASRGLPRARLETTAHIGELGLDGSRRRPPGLLRAVLAARAHGFSRVLVPAEAAPEAHLVPDMEVVPLPSLAAAVAWHRGDWVADPEVLQVTAAASPAAAANDTAPAPHDMEEVIGQPEAVEAMTIAAAGRHHISLLGPPGAGKTLLATRLPSLLPDLTPQEALTASSIASLGGKTLTALVSRPPFESPHHSTSLAAIVGGGDSRGIRAGAVSRACHGVLFLDEAPEFGRAVLDGLRQPLESGIVEISRARFNARLPARVQLVLASNPCPCGNAGSTLTAFECSCSPHTRARYQARLSGPLTDRIDVRLTVPRVSTVFAQEVLAEPRPTSAQLRARVETARDRAAHRLRDTPWFVNSEVPGAWLRGAARLPRGDTSVIDRALARGSLTLRGYDRTLRVAWSIADLAGKARPTDEDVARALTLRGGAA